MELTDEDLEAMTDEELDTAYRFAMRSAQQHAQTTLALSADCMLKHGKAPSLSASDLALAHALVDGDVPDEELIGGEA